MRSKIPRLPSELTPAWLTGALRERGFLGERSVTGVEVEIVGEGEGFIGLIARLKLRFDGPAPGLPSSLIAKLPTRITKNRVIGEMMGVYEREIRFYEELASGLKIATPACYYSEMDPNPLAEREPAIRDWIDRAPDWLLRFLLRPLRWLARLSRRRYVLFLEDLAPARVGDTVAGCTPARAERALRALAVAQAGMWNSPKLTDLSWILPLNVNARFGHVVYRSARPRFFRDFGRSLPTSAVAAADWLDGNGIRLVNAVAERPFTLVHGDYRLDNLFFSGPEDAEKVTALDWQGATRGLGAIDAAYFISGNLEPDIAAAHELDLLRAYHSELSAQGVADYSFEECLGDYRLALLLQVYRMIAGLELLEILGGRGIDLVDRSVQRLFARLPSEPYDTLLPPGA